MTVQTGPAPQYSGSAHAPLFRFGVISDVQWGDLPDGASFHGTPRYYREALVSARRAVSAFKAAKVDLAIHLGDIVDYHNSHHQGKSETALAAAIECFDDLGVPVLHCIGNHCLYNAPRSKLNELLGINVHKSASQLSGQHSYFTFRPRIESTRGAGTGYRFVVLDGYDISLLGWPEGHPLHEQAKSILQTHNKNQDMNSNVGLEGLNKRFVRFGGGVSQQQLGWLQQELELARNEGDRVIVCCHLCLHPETCAPTCLLWNYEEVLEILQANSDVVVASLVGHAHRDGYVCDEAGIHHRVCEAVLETPPGLDCFGIVSVYDDKIVVAGHGSFDSAVWPLRSKPDGKTTSFNRQGVSTTKTTNIIVSTS